MPKYVTLDWDEFSSMKDNLSRLEREVSELKTLRYDLMPLVLTEEDRGYYSSIGPLPPVNWRPITNEEIVKRIKERFETPLS